MIVSPWEAAATAAKLVAVGVLPGFLFTLGVFPRMPLTQRVAIGAAVSLAVPALVETLVGHYAGVRLTLPVAAALTVGVASFGLLALPRRREWREWLRPAARTGRWTILALVTILVAGAFLNFKPHIGYDLPIHRDEWIHYDAAVYIERAGGNVSATAYHNAGFDRNPEVAFHVLLLHARLLTGVEWEPLLLVWPTLVFGLLIVALFAVTAPYGYGLETALMALAIPTSLRVMGPQFVIPLALGLFLIPVAYALFLRPERVRAWALLAAVMAFTYLAHPPSAVAVAFLMMGYASMSIRRHWRMGLALLPLAAVPFILAKLEAPEHFTSAEAIASQEITLPVPTFMELFGIVPALLFAVGVYGALYSLKAERLGWLATSLAHLGIIFVYLQFQMGVNILYDRAWMHGLLTMSVTAAAGLALLRQTLVARLPATARWARFAAVVGLALVVLAPSVAAQHARESEYYRVVTPQEYEDFAWVRDNLVLVNGTRAALDPFKATAFHAVTGIQPLVKSWALQAPPWHQKFFDDGCVDEQFATTRDVGLIYAHTPVLNPSFGMVRESIYVRAA